MSEISGRACNMRIESESPWYTLIQILLREICGCLSENCKFLPPPPTVLTHDPAVAVTTINRHCSIQQRYTQHTIRAVPKKHFNVQLNTMLNISFRIQVFEQKKLETLNMPMSGF